MTVLNAVTFNAVGAMPTDRGPLARRCLKAASKRGALLLGVECDDLSDHDLEEILGPEWWWTHNAAPERDGLLVAGRCDRTRTIVSRYLPGAPSSPVNATRAILRTRLVVDESWGLTVAVCHFPRPGHGGQDAHDAMIANTRGIGADLLAGDFNIRRPAVRAHWRDRRIASDGVIHLAASRELVMTDPRGFDLLEDTTADDHHGLKASVRHRRHR